MTKTARHFRRVAVDGPGQGSSNRRIFALAGLLAVALVIAVYLQWVPLPGIFGGAASDQLTNNAVVFSETFAGDGPRNSHLFALKAGNIRIDYGVPAEGPTEIRLVNMAGNAIETLRAGKGQSTGSKIVRLPASASYALSVQSPGPWTVTITQ